MKEITVSTSFGRFAYTATAVVDINEPVSKTLQKILDDGLASICFRAGGSDAEKALVKAGKMKKDDKRSEIPYSLESQNILEQSFNAKLKELELADVEVSFTGEHVFGEETFSRKKAEALFTQIVAAPAEKQAAMAIAYGYGEDDNKEQIIQKLHVFLSSLSAPRRQK